MKFRIFGFTLTEILAVAAIVSSMPIGAYQRGKQKALQTKCMSNLQQIGQLLTMYVLENGEYPPAAFFPKNPSKGDDSIRSLLGGPKQLWVCPSLPGELQKKGLTFIYNDSLVGKSALENPDKKWVLIEMSCVSKGSPHPHPGGYNILFADGHILASKKLPKKITKTFN